MSLTEQQQTFIQRRRKSLVVCRILVLPVLVTLLALIAVMWLQVPQFINPFVVFRMIEANTLDATSAMTMAAVLPVVVLLLMFVLVFCLTLAYELCRHERKYLDIVAALQSQART